MDISITESRYSGRKWQKRSFSLSKLLMGCCNWCKLLHFFFSFSFVWAWKLVFASNQQKRCFAAIYASNATRLDGKLFELKLFLMFFHFLRFPWNVLCQYPMCNSWTWKDLGVGSILWPFDLCCLRRHSTKVRQPWKKGLIKNSTDERNFCSFVDCSNSSKTAVHCHLLTINANWTLKPPTKRLHSHTAAPSSSVKLEQSWSTQKLKKKREIKKVFTA